MRRLVAAEAEEKGGGTGCGAMALSSAAASPAQQATFVTTLLSPVAMRAWRVTSTCKATVARGSPMVE